MAESLPAAPLPIKPGEIWPDDRGRHIQAHGGGIIRISDTYYWFGEDRGEGLDRNLRYVNPPGDQARRSGKLRPAAGFWTGVRRKAITR
jgi:hypothetical protein